MVHVSARRQDYRHTVNDIVYEIGTYACRMLFAKHGRKVPACCTVCGNKYSVRVLYVCTLCTVSTTLNIICCSSVCTVYAHILCTTGVRYCTYIERKCKRYTLYVMLFVLYSLSLRKSETEAWPQSNDSRRIRL